MNELDLQREFSMRLGFDRTAYEADAYTPPPDDDESPLRVQDTDETITLPKRNNPWKRYSKDG